MYNIRLAFAFLFPGFIPTSLFFYVTERNTTTSEINYFTLYVLVSIAVGVFIDVFRHRFENYFVLYFGFTRAKKIFQRIVKKIFKKEIKVIDVKEASQAYEEREKEIIKLWIANQLDKNKAIAEKIKGNKILESEYINPSITSGDRWALLNIISAETMDFFLREYFIYYQFCFNCLIGFLIAFILNIVFLCINMVTLHQFWIILSICLPFLWLLHERAIHWLLSCRRYSRKVLLYSIIKDGEDNGGEK